MTLIFRCLFVITIVSVTVLALLPQGDVQITTGWDKANHFFAFFVLLLLLDNAYPLKNMWTSKIPVLVFYGVLLEILQAFSPDRQASLLDVVADISGLAGYQVIVVGMTSLAALFKQR